MGKKLSCCKNCKRPTMPTDSSKFTASLTSGNSYYQWIVVFIAFVLMGTWLIPEVQKQQEDHMSYYAAKIDILKRKMPAIRISGIDFVSSAIRERHTELAYQMAYVCSQRSDDAVFAFQFGSDNHSRWREDHIFALCGKKQVKVYGNAEVISSSEDLVLCAEEYDGVLKQVKRPSSIVLKAIDIDEWEVIERSVEDSREACVIQHAIDVLESKWV
tara:strand:- start:101 stop:745 length:645 start_codon:yes stop_codon:yes gene_type:complete